MRGARSGARKPKTDRPKRGMFRRKRVCRFCVDKIPYIDYKDVETLKRFVNEVPWAHLDIAGTAMGSPSNAYNQSWASGFGVRLLERLVADHYETR